MVLGRHLKIPLTNFPLPLVFPTALHELLETTERVESAIVVLEGSG